LLPSGLERIFDNRVHWAKTYLKKAGLLDNSRRAHLIITKRGLNILKSNPSFINIAFLKQFPEFLAFQNYKREGKSELSSAEEENNVTPEELLADGYSKIRTSLIEELISKVVSLSAQFFERLVVELLVKMGYGGSIQDAGKAIGKTGDEGIDGVIKEDKLGLDIIYIQAKRWKPGNTVGRPEVQRFIGALAGQGAKKGVFITTSSFSKDALDYAPKNETKIVLIDGVKFAELMIDYDLGVSTQSVYHIKKLDSDYFEGEE
jgi:restriction system protein